MTREYVRRKYTKELLKDAVSKNVSMAGVLRLLGVKPSGGTQSHITRMIQNFDIDYSHFTGQAHNKNKPSFVKKSSDEILIVSLKTRREDGFRLKRALLEIGRPYECELCKNDGVYNGLPLTLQVDHIDGDYLNNLEYNLRFVCPNCHTQTSNYGSKKLVVSEAKQIKQKIVVKKNRPRKFEVTKEELTRLVWEMPTTKVGQMFGVSDKAIDRRCKLLCVDKPPRGYWAKQRSLRC